MTAKLYTTKVGAGVRVRVSLLSPRDNSGVITAFICPGGSTVVTKDNLATIAQATLPLTFPGTGTLRKHVDATLLKGNGAILKGVYSSSLNGKGGFRQVFSSKVVGYRSVKFYDITPAYTQVESNYIDYENKQLRPILIPTPLIAVRWSGDFYKDPPGPDRNEALAGKYNSNAYEIDGYEHEEGSLQFNGTDIAHYKWAAYDQWTYQHTATWDPLFKYRNDFVVADGPERPPTTTPEGETIRRGWNFIRPNPDGVPIYQNSFVDMTATFPDLP